MANELRHKDAIAGRVREDEYEHVRQHILNGQATGDMVYASSATQLKGRAIGSTGQVLVTLSGLPTWSNTGVKLTAPDISGVVTAAAALTMPAFTMAGSITGGNNILTGVGQITSSTGDPALRRSTNNSFIRIAGGTNDGGAKAASIFLGGSTYASVGLLELATPRADLAAALARLSITGGVDTAVLTFADVLITGIVLSGPLTLGGQVLDAGAGALQINTTGGSNGLVIQVTNDGQNGARIFTDHISSSPTGTDIPFHIAAHGRNDIGGGIRYHLFQVVLINAASGFEESQLIWKLQASGENQAMTLSGAGVLDVKDSLKVNATQVVSAQGAAVADPTDAASTQARLTDLLGRLRTHGMIAT